MRVRLVAVLVIALALAPLAYFMGMPAEEAAAFQTMGFFERQLEIAGAKDIDARFRSRSWAGDQRTVLTLRWE